MRAALVLAATVLAPTASPCQGPPGTNLSVDVRVTSVTMRSDTVTVEYVLYTRPNSAERLIFFTVETPEEPISVSLPEPTRAWSNGTTYGDRTVASWAALGRIAQGSSSPPLFFRERGLPGIAKAWYRGDRLPTLGEDEGEYPEPDPSVPVPAPPPVDPLTDLSVETRTVGVDPAPADATTATLTSRLASLTAQSCALGWITQAKLCATLRGHLTARPSRLSSFVRDLAAGHTAGGLVNDNAYWLLKVNAEYIVSREPVRKR
jgi:hypothetical protein